MSGSGRLWYSSDLSYSSVFDLKIDADFPMCADQIGSRPGKENSGPLKARMSCDKVPRLLTIECKSISVLEGASRCAANFLDALLSSDLSYSSREQTAVYDRMESRKGWPREPHRLLRSLSYSENRQFNDVNGNFSVSRSKMGSIARRPQKLFRIPAATSSCIYCTHIMQRRLVNNIEMSNTA